MTIVFFFPVILRDNFRQVYPFEQLMSEGHEVILLDSTKFFGIYKSTLKDNFLLSLSRECETEKDFLQFKNRLNYKPVIYVTSDLYLGSAAQVLRIIVRRQDRLLSTDTRYTVAHYHPPKGIPGAIKNFLKVTDRFFPLEVFRNRIYPNFYHPDYFLGSSSFLVSTKTRLTVKRENRFFVHVDDINLLYNIGKGTQNEKKTGVFLDQMLPYFKGRNPDVEDFKFNKVYKINYYKNITRFLKKAKKELNLDQIVIALHPEAEQIREEIDIKFRPFPTVAGATAELINNSSIVFGHFSTALGMAVFLKKPIVLLKDDYLLSDSVKNDAIKLHTRELGLDVFRTDKDEKVTLSSMEIDEKRYNSYTKRFLKENPYVGNAYYFVIKKMIDDMCGSVTVDKIEIAEKEFHQE